MSLTTTRGALPYPEPADADKPRLDLQALAQQVAAVAALYGEGNAASRPPATAARAGTFYRATDTGLVSFCTGTAWLNIQTGTEDLSAYALDANVLHKTGDETAAGSKTFTGTVQAATLREGSNRVYSAGFPPPPSGAVIVQTIRGVAFMSDGASQVDVTIPSVVMAKTQVRFLGSEFVSGSAQAQGPGTVQLINSTTLRFRRGGSGATTFSYELTEWS